MVRTLCLYFRGPGWIPAQGTRSQKRRRSAKTKQNKTVISENSWLLINRNLYKDIKICMYIYVHKYTHILHMYIYDMYGFKYMYIP